MNDTQQNKLLSQLNDAQRQAVQNIKGPTLIVAGAGSGKTRVITYRIANLLLQKVSPFNILALTFTNKASQVMKNRILGLTQHHQGRYLWAGTFHSIFARLLRVESIHIPYPENFTIYDTSDALSVIRSIVKEMDISKKAYNSRQILSRISSLKNELITGEDYQKQKDFILQDEYRLQPKFADVYLRYQNKCIVSGAMDFDDLLLQTYQLLKTNPQILQKYQSRFKYILVDEYQDINEVQYQVVNLLADKYENVCVVGDDAQSIYAFRGAKIKYIQDFRKRYRNASIYRLEQNYRSTKNIIRAANSIIKHNKKQIEKTLFTENPIGNKVCVVNLNSEIAEATFIKDEIIKVIQKGYTSTGLLNQRISSYNEVCILYRTNAQSRVFEEVFSKFNIPYQIYGGISFYERSEVKDVLAYLKLIMNHNDRESFKRIISKPTRGIGPTTVDKLIVFADQYQLSLMEAIDKLNKIPYGISQLIIDRLGDFKSMINRFVVESKQLNAFELCKLVIKRTQIIDFVKKRSETDEIANEKENNINELLNSVSDFIQEAMREDDQELDITLGSYLQTVALYTSQDQEKQDLNRLTLMTVHLSKGLEFPCVFVVGLEEDLFPSALNNTPEGIEEERRLMYVATTRAEKLLYLTYTNSRFKAGERMFCYPSQFLSEIDQKFIFRISKTNFTQPVKQYKPKTNIEYAPSKISAIMEPRKFDKLKKVDHLDVDDNGEDYYPNLKTGSKVDHETFGLGVVETIEGKGQNKKAMIKFEKTQTTKKLLLAYAKIKVLRTKS